MCQCQLDSGLQICTQGSVFQTSARLLSGTRAQRMPGWEAYVQAPRLSPKLSFRTPVFSGFLWLRCVSCALDTIPISQGCKKIAKIWLNLFEVCCAITSLARQALGHSSSASPTWTVPTMGDAFPSLHLCTLQYKLKASAPRLWV